MVDEMALYRQVDTPAVMAAQLRHLAEVSAKPRVTLTVMPAIAHPASDSGVIMVRDTTNRDGVTLSLPAAAWRRFTDALK